MSGATDARVITRAHVAVEAAGGVLTVPAIGRRFGVSRQRAYQFVATRDFPDPLPTCDPDGSRVWLALEVDAWRAASLEGRTR